MTDWILHTCDRLEERYYERTHPSGLRILVSPKDLSACYATLGVNYGSRDRFAGGTLPMGTAHFLEHKMFEQPDGSGWEDVFAAYGADVNAYTSDDSTAYMFSATEHIPQALQALITMVSELSVTSSSVSRERHIIAEEIRMNADDPWEVVYANMLRGLYAPTRNGGHPVREEICGTESSISRITPAVLREAHSRFYRPSNMVLAVSGPVTPSEVWDAIEAVPALMEWKSQPYVPGSTRVVREGTGVYKPAVTQSMDTVKPLFCIGIKHPAPPEDSVALLRTERLMTLLAETLFSRSGDFYSSLFESGTVSPGMSYGSSVGRGSLGRTAGSYGYFYLSGECDDPSAVFTAFRDYVGSVKRNGLDTEALSRARRTLYADYIYGFDSTESIASSLLTTAMDGIGLYELMELDESLTEDQLWSLFSEVFTESQYTLSTVYPWETGTH